MSMNKPMPNYARSSTLKECPPWCFSRTTRKLGRSQGHSIKRDWMRLCLKLFDQILNKYNIVVMQFSIEKSVIKFLEVALNSSWTLPSALATQMRDIQTLLKFKQHEELHNYVEDLGFRLSAQTGRKKTLKTEEKQNFSLFANTLRLNEPDTKWEKPKLNANTFQLKSIENLEKQPQNPKKAFQAGNDVNRKSSKTLLKITKKIRDKCNKNLETHANEMMEIFNHNDKELEGLIKLNI